MQLRPTAYGAGSAQPEEDLAESHRASANGPYLKGGGVGGGAGKWSGPLLGRFCVYAPLVGWRRLTFFPPLGSWLLVDPLGE